MGQSRLTAAKLVTALVGIALFGTGIRWDVPALRGAGIAMVAVAWALRFAGPRSRRRGQLPDETW
jgi:hypothetical protein